MTFHLDNVDQIDPIDPDEFVIAIENLRVAIILSGRNPTGAIVQTQHPTGTFPLPIKRLTREQAVELLKQLNTQRTST